MEDYNLAMFTHAMDFFKEHSNMKKSIPIFFHKLVKQFVERKFGNAWQLAINIVYETQKTIVCNSEHVSQVSLGATKIKELLKPLVNCRMIGSASKPRKLYNRQKQKHVEK
jgi:hypothetical protein